MGEKKGGLGEMRLLSEKSEEHWGIHIYAYIPGGGPGGAGRGGQVGGTSGMGRVLWVVPAVNVPINGCLGCMFGRSS